MKKFLKFLFVSAFALLCVTGISSCSKDDDDQPVDPSSIVGTWRESYTEWWAKENGVITDQGSEPDDEIMYVFHSNGKVDIYDGEYDEIYHTEMCKVNGNTLIIYYDEEELADGDVATFTIESVSQDTLVLSQYESGKDEDGTWEDYYKTTFKRVK